MEESTCYEMVIHLSQRFSSMLDLCCCFLLHFFISFKYDFHVDAEEWWLKRKKCKEMSTLMV